MREVNRTTYLVEGIEIDPAASLVRRDGQEWTLRQKSFQTLVYLLEHHDRLVTKDELIDCIWEGAAVTDDTLVQIIVELRRMLGDDARQPRFIRTIPKSGYHFIAPVTIRFPGDAHAPEDALIEIEEVTTVQIVFERAGREETGGRQDGETGGRGDGERELYAEMTPGNFLLRAAASPRPRIVIVAAFSLIVALGAGWLAFRRVDEAPRLAVTIPRAPGKMPVAVMYFENRAGDRALDWLREGLADMLITSLSRSNRLALLSRQQLTALLGHVGHQGAAQIKLEDGLEVARRAQAEMMILGGFARLGDKVRIDVTLHDAATGQLRAAESLIADSPAQILTQIDLLSLKLATHLGATPSSDDTQRGLAATMTNSLDAYRYYSLALEQTQMFQFHEAIALLEKALALDPQFAMAHARIGYVYAVRMGQGEKARSYLEKALTMAGRLREKDKLYITAWLANATRDPARGIEIYRELLARYPMETEAYLRLNWLLQSQNRPDEALAAIRQGLLTDPDGKDLYNAQGTACMRLGRNAEALAAFQRYIQLAPNDPNAWDSLGGFHQWIGQFAEAEAAYNRGLALNPESGVLVLHLGNLWFQQGRYQAAARQYQRYSQIARDDAARAAGFASLAWVYWKKGDITQADRAVREEAKYNPAPLWNSLLLALDRGDQALAVKLRDGILTPAAYENWKERGFLRFWEYMHGYVALRQGQADKATHHFRAVLQHRAVEWNIDSYESCLADASLELGRLDEAIAEYERILQINPRFPLAAYHLARAYAQKGDPARARVWYSRFVDDWKDADANIPELIDAKRQLAH
ncbi:MAG: tetratricopeptide repeat protein [Blastocatellia bacterium]